MVWGKIFNAEILPTLPFRSVERKNYQHQRIFIYSAPGTTSEICLSHWCAPQKKIADEYESLLCVISDDRLRKRVIFAKTGKLAGISVPFAPPPLASNRRLSSPILLQIFFANENQLKGSSRASFPVRVERDYRVTFRPHPEIRTSPVLTQAISPGKFMKIKVAESFRDRGLRFWAGKRNLNMNLECIIDKNLARGRESPRTSRLPL